MRTLFVVVLAACSPASPDPDSCAGVAPDACATYRSCATITGFRQGSTEREDAGCAYAENPDDFACPAVEVCAHDPAAPDVCWTITSGCIPDGWATGCADGEDACFTG